MNEIYKEHELLRNLINSGILLFSLLTVRFLTVRSITRSTNLKVTEKRAWRAHANNFLTLLFILGLVIVWAAKLQAFALSLVAVGVAVVVGTKELIMCVLGGIYKSFVRPFKIGDRVSISTFRGDVIDHSFLSTELLEIAKEGDPAQYTGRSIELPNSLFLSHPILKESGSAKFNLHTFSVVQSIGVDIEKYRSLLLESAQDACQPYLHEAKMFFDTLQKRESLEPPTVDPRVSVTFKSKDSIDFIIRVPIPALRAAKIEQDIIIGFVRKVHEIEQP